MWAGPRPQQKRGITRRFLYKTEAQCRALFPDAIVERKGERYITVHKKKKLEDDEWAQRLTISLSWENMSNGESVGTILLDGKRPGWGNLKEQLKAAYAAL